MTDMLSSGSKIRMSIMEISRNTAFTNEFYVNSSGVFIQAVLSRLLGRRIKGSNDDSCTEGSNATYIVTESKVQGTVEDLHSSR